MECRLKAKKCGGCPMLGLDYAEQLKQKEAAVRKLVGKYGPVAPIRGAENPCHYRNKVISTFAAGPGGKLVSGIYAAGTHKVLPVESCLLQDEVLDKTMHRIELRSKTPQFFNLFLYKLAYFVQMYMPMPAPASTVRSSRSQNYAPWPVFLRCLV